MACALIGFVGLLDDLVGETDIKGFKGHIKAFLKEIDHRSFKAGMGFYCFIYFYSFSNSLLDVVINTLIISLFTNLTNLFDLRPGRSIKYFVDVNNYVAYKCYR